MSDVRESYPKSARLRRREEFKAISRRARRQLLPHFVLLVADGARGGRIGITVSRKVGCAVRRNRVKRLVREIFRRQHLAGSAGWDLVVIARPGASQLGYQETARELASALQRARSQRQAR